MISQGTYATVILGPSPRDNAYVLMAGGLTFLAILNDNLLMSALPQASLRGKRRPRPEQLNSLPTRSPGQGRISAGKR